MNDKTNAFESLDRQPLQRFHLLAMLTTGMGVFTDGYDLSSIGLVLPVALATFGIHTISGLQSGMLAGSALVGAAIGAILFGALAQRGRKRFYGIDVGLMAAAAAAQAFAPNLWSLIVIRFFLGIGVGADYVLSPTIMAEHANAQDRGKKIAFGFAGMWNFGALASGLVFLTVRALHVAPYWQWRIVLAAGALPALSVLSLRRRMPETARYLARLEGASEDARKVIKNITGEPPTTAPKVDRRDWRTVLQKHARPILGAMTLWFLYDVVLYSGVLFGPSVIAESMGLTAISFTLMIYGLFTIPGTLVGCSLIDRMGRKRLMASGFVISSLALLVFVPMMKTGGALVTAPLLTVILFGLYTFSLSAGPGIVSGSGILGVELAPTRVRSIAQGITVVGGRAGAVVAAFVFPLLLKQMSARSLMTGLAVLSLISAALTLVLVPETKCRSLEEINRDTDSDIAKSTEFANF